MRLAGPRKFKSCLLLVGRTRRVTQCSTQTKHGQSERVGRVFWCEYFQPDHEMPDDDEHDPDEGPDEMFRFIKVMK